MKTNKFICAWIWVWYNDITRLCIVVGMPSFIAVIMARAFFGPGEHLKCVAMATYIGFFAWALLDNNYSNLRRIGLDEYRRKLNVKHEGPRSC